MKRYSFGLETVLRARRLQQDLARSGLQKANMAATMAELAARTGFEHYREVSASGDDSQFMAHRQQAELAAGSLVGARRALAAARAAVDEAMADYLAKAKAVSVLEHLDERRREEHALTAQREEAAMIDDLVVSRHTRRQQHTAKGQR